MLSIYPNPKKKQFFQPTFAAEFADSMLETLSLH
jgi:hypothetical protein